MAQAPEPPRPDISSIFTQHTTPRGGCDAALPAITIVFTAAILVGFAFAFGVLN
ncbi:MAG: hypothetical protein ABF931_09025 [Acetobacter pasteurianus]